MSFFLQLIPLSQSPPPHLYREPPQTPRGRARPGRRVKTPSRWLAPTPSKCKPRKASSRSVRKQILYMKSQIYKKDAWICYITCTPDYNHASLFVFLSLTVAIIGGVIGTLSFILIVLLVLLGLKWLKERRRRMDKNRFIEVQNPAYRNSTEFRNVPNDNFYNYIDC